MVLCTSAVLQLSTSAVLELYNPAFLHFWNLYFSNLTCLQFFSSTVLQLCSAAILQFYNSKMFQKVRWIQSWTGVDCSLQRPQQAEKIHGINSAGSGEKLNSPAPRKEVAFLFFLCEEVKVSAAGFETGPNALLNKVDWHNSITGTRSPTHNLHISWGHRLKNLITISFFLHCWPL